MKLFVFFMAILLTTTGGIMFVANLPHNSDYFFFITFGRSSLGYAFLLFALYGAIWGFFVMAFVKGIFSRKNK